MGAPLEVLCPQCSIPFTRHGAASSSHFYRTREGNETCIVCREGLDPVTLEPLAPRGEIMIEPGKPEKLTDVELVEALELAAPRIRMAAADDLRHVADALAGLALEAAGRLRDVLELEGITHVTPRPPAPGPMLGKVRGVVLHADGRLTCELEIPDAGATFLQQIKRAGA